MAFTATTSTSASAWRPDLYSFAPAAVLPDAVLLNHSFVAGEIKGDAPSLRVAYAVDDSAQFVAEGDEITEAAPELNEALIYSRKFAQLLRISREQYSQDGTAEELARSVARAMTTKADAAFLAQPAPISPAAAPAAGLVHVAGSAAAVVTSDLDPLIDLEAAVRVNGAAPTAWLLSPDVWAALRKVKTQTGSAVGLLGAGTDQAEARLLSIPVVVNAQVPTGTGLLVDKTAIISAVSTLEIATDAAPYFSSDCVAVRATMRTGHTLPRPNRLGIFYVDTIKPRWTVAIAPETPSTPITGTFVLEWRNAYTPALAHNATAATLKAALVALGGGYTADNWTVTGSAGGPYTITAPGGGALTGDGSGLTGGTIAITL